MDIAENRLIRLEQLTKIGIALSAEKDCLSLMEQILVGAKKITRADGGTLYMLNEETQELEFNIIRTTSLNFQLGGKTGKPISPEIFKPIPLMVNNKINKKMVATYVACTQESINIKDVYLAEGFDFTGTQNFDKKSGYRTKSILTIPMKNHQNDVIGVLQLLNKQDDHGETSIFSYEDEQLALSLASLAAVSLTNQRLILDFENLFESFIQLLASAIDEKSPYTGGHCRRVPEITMMLSAAAEKMDQGYLQNYQLSEEERKELSIAAWLHDCGKVTTPEYVVDKATKLETIFDRIALLNTRFEVLRRDCEILCLRNSIDATTYAEKIKEINADQAFVEHQNTGSEFMSEEKQQRIKEIAKKYQYSEKGQMQDFLSADEVKNLCIAKGTLTDEEREIINHHIVATINMLNELPFPKHLKRVPEIAGGHHERMDGKGYPNGLTREEMSIPARIMAIADIFEALTSADRPYKTGKTLTESLRILGFMKKEGHIDPDLFDVFIREKIYQQYAEKYMQVSQIDVVDESKIPGYDFIALATE